MIPIEKIPRLKARWARAEAAFRADPVYVVEMAEDAAKVHAKRMAKRERDEVAAIAQAEREAERQAARDERQRQREEERQAKRDAMRALVPDSDGALRYRARMAAMTTDEQAAFHKAKNEAHAGKRDEEKAEKAKAEKIKTAPKPKRVPMTREEERERKNAKAGAKRAAMSPEERQAHDRERNARARAARSPERQAEMREYQRVWAAEKKRRQREAGGDVGGTA